MENASKALLMAAGVLIGILIMSLAVYLFATFGATSAQINKQNEDRQLAQFNSRFTSYEGKKDLTIYDVITVAGYAKENNNYYNDDDKNSIYVTVNRGSLATINNLQNNLANKNTIITQDQATITGNNSSLPTYSCKVTEYQKNGRVRKVVFTRN